MKETLIGRYLRRHIVAVGVFASLLLLCGEALAAGFFLPGRGLRPMGRGGAYVASGKGNPNSLWYNPANLAFDDLTLNVDLALLNLNFEFQRAPREAQNGETITYDRVENTAPPEPDPQILIGGPTGVDNLSWGAGLYAPYMSGSVFPEDGPQRYVLVSNDGSAIAYMHAAVAYEIGDWIRVGAGFQNVFASFRLVNVTSGYAGLHGRPEDKDLDILTKIEMHDPFTPTGNAGIWLKLMPQVEAALSVQLPVTIKDDDAELTVRMPSSPEFDSASMSNDTVSGSLNLPTMLRMGLRYAHDRFDVEVAGVYEGWSTFERIEATPNNIVVQDVSGVGDIPVEPLSITKNYRDTWSIRAGTDIRANERLTLRTGYIFETGAIRDAYYDVFLPDSDKHAFAGGMTWHIDDWEVDASFAYYAFANRTITNSKVKQINPTDAEDELAIPVANGEYSASYVVGGLGVKYRF